MAEAGKGSKARPFSVSQEEYATRWDAIFQRDKVSEEIKEQERQSKLTEEKEEKA
jgi:hypothetical protein